MVSKLFVKIIIILFENQRERALSHLPVHTLNAGQLEAQFGSVILDFYWNEYLVFKSMHTGDLHKVHGKYASWKNYAWASISKMNIT